MRSFVTMLWLLFALAVLVCGCGSTMRGSPDDDATATTGASASVAASTGAATGSGGAGTGGGGSSGAGGSAGGASCIPEPACTAAAPDPGTASPWKHASNALVAGGTPKHRGRDLFFRPGEPQWIIAKFAYGL